MPSHCEEIQMRPERTHADQSAGVLTHDQSDVSANKQHLARRVKEYTSRF